MRAIAALCVAGLLAGCVHQQVVDVGDGLAAQLAERGQPRVTAACPMTLVSLEDARLQGEQAGIVFGFDTRLPEALALLESELGAAGLRRDVAGGLPVRVVLKKLYLTQIYETKTPTVVLAHAGADGRERLVRARDTSIVWGGSQESFEKAMAGVLRQAVEQLVAEANAACPA